MTAPKRTHDTDTSRLDARAAREWMRAARRGDFAAAWMWSDAIRARTVCFGDPSRPRHLQQIWDGSPIEGRRVLVRCYHGLGDTIQFARFLPMVRRLAREVTVWAQPQLLDVLSTMEAGVTLLPLHDGAPEVDYDVDVEIMELAHVFRTTLDTIPHESPYLKAPCTFEACGAGPPKTKVGVVWRAGTWNTARSLAFEDLTPLFDDAEDCDIAWYSLQFDAREDESHPCVLPIPGGSIAETAALIDAMDLVITIDSVTAHLAGALGRPVWTLLPYDADWRWMQHRDDSPWYPSMRLFRQASAGDWNGVVVNVANTLSGLTTPARRRGSAA